MGRKKRGYPTVEFSPTIRQGMSAALGGIVGVSAVQLYFWIADGLFLPGVTIRFSGGLFLSSALGGLIGKRRFGVVLTPWTAEVHNLRRRVIWWPDVEAIRVERVMFSRTVVIYEFGGRRTRLRAPITGFLFWDRRFEEKYHAIGRWWLEHRMIQPGPAGPAGSHDTPPTAFPVNDAVPSTADTVADDVPQRSSSRVPRRGLT